MINYVQKKHKSRNKNRVKRFYRDSDAATKWIALNYYSRKSQYIFSGFLALAFFFCLFLYYEDSKLEHDPTTLGSYKVVAQHCHYARNRSSIHIEYNNDTRFIRMGYERCRRYPVGSIINLHYNTKFDYFHIPGLETDKFRVWMTLTFFALSLVPWKVWVKTVVRFGKYISEKNR
ncbi:MAG: hypothetical protein LBE36_01670 [Flavobacteriaceae bacterium]|jgi:hypothetical protein|nr:hypothetical protein [Flavobacteriaceae bacterium]